MDSTYYLQALYDLRSRILEYNSAVSDKDEATENLKKAQSQIPTAIKEFDSNNKDSYISARVGEKPTKPTGIIKLAIPLYRSKLKQYEKDLLEYNSRYKKCEADYYQVYAEQRNQIETDERLEMEFKINNAKKQFEEACSKEKKLKQELDSYSLLNDKHKKLSIIDSLISYFQDKRADTIKEAINLYYEEEHRCRLEELTRQQLKVVEETKEMAQYALNNAQQAISKAEYAINRAEDAYRKAEEAYREADDAYMRASSYN